MSETVNREQSAHYEESYDYLEGSPHLKHDELNSRLIDQIATTFGPAERAGGAATVLEVGAGDGSMTGPLLGMGYRIVATEMSTASAERMRMRFHEEEGLEVIHDPDGSLAPLGGRRFDAVLFASVLHHIPDYLGTIRLALDGLLRAGGSLASIQDPLWYPRLPRATRAASEGAYLSWRLTRGNLLHGVATRVRRVKGGVGEEHPGDVVEYHVVRDGVDELAILELLDGHFDKIHLDRYWSSQGQIQQRVGEAVGLENTFGIFASGFRS